MRRAAAAVVVAVLTLPACGCGDGLLFRNDHRITVTSPQNFGTVGQPVVVRFAVRDFRAPADGHFAVLFDLSPPAPGQTLGDIPPAQRQFVRTVDTTEVAAPHFFQDESATGPLPDHHEVTVILLDPSGRRIGETAGFAEFDLQR